MGQNDKSSAVSEFPWKEILTVLVPVIVAYIGYLGIRAQTELPINATQTAQAISLITSSPIYPTPSVIMSQLPNGLLSTITPFASATQTLTSNLAIPSSSLSTDNLLTSFTPVPPPAGFGALTVKSLEGCNGSFTIILNEQFLTTVADGERKLIAEGTYHIQLQSEIRGAPVQKTVTIQEGDDKVVDFGNDIGILNIMRYPNFDLPLAYIVFQNKNVVGSFLSSDKHYCASPGVYEISFSPSFVDIKFDVEIKAGKTTAIGSNEFPQEIGVLSFLSTKNETPTFRIFDQNTGEQTGLGGYRANSMWVKVGIYKIVISDPYIGLTYEDIEIKAGEETTITLP